MGISHLHAAWLFTTVLLVMGLLPAQGAQDDWTLSGPEQTREGYFQLRLDGPDERASFIVEQSTDEDFTEVVASFSPLGSFRQISLSGFDDGHYYFRAHIEVAGESLYSNVHPLEVRHYPLWQALGLFIMGALVFIALLGTLWHLHRGLKSARTASESGSQ